MSYGGKGAQFTIHESGDSPTIQSTFYIFFGQVSVIMQAANGTGIISSIVLESDDLDEIDWEFMGGNTTHVETNFFGKGNTTSYDRAIYYPMDQYAADNGNGTAPQAGWHNYTTNWMPDKLEWWIDGNLARTLNYDDPVALGGKNYPQTPCTVRLGIWAGGDPKEPAAVQQWAGGVTDFKDAPFNMFVQQVYVQDYHTGAEYYMYGDETGDYQSIKVTQCVCHSNHPQSSDCRPKLTHSPTLKNPYPLCTELSSPSRRHSHKHDVLTPPRGESSTLKELNKPHTVEQHWDALSKTARIAIIACSIGGLVLLLSFLTYYCISQGIKGRKEKAVADAEFEKEQQEFNYYRMQMMKGGFAQSSYQV